MTDLIKISPASRYWFASALTGAVILVPTSSICPLMILDPSFAHGAYVLAAGLAIYLSVRAVKTATAQTKTLPFLIFWLVCLTPLLLIGLCAISTRPHGIEILDKKKNLTLIRYDNFSEPDCLICVRTVIPNLIGQRLLTLQFWPTSANEGSSECKLLDENYAYVRLQSREFKLPVYPPRFLTNEMLQAGLK